MNKIKNSNGIIPIAPLIAFLVMAALIALAYIVLRNNANEHGNTTTETQKPTPQSSNVSAPTPVAQDIFAPKTVSSSAIDSFIANHVTYEGGTATTFKNDFTQFAQYMGGDIFISNLLAKYPHSMLTITSSYKGYAESYAGNTTYNKAYWDSQPERRVPVLIHEYVHHFDYGEGAKKYYEAERANPSMQWDVYAMNNHIEFIACGFEWVVKNDLYDTNETKRERLKRLDPAFYEYLTTSFIPWMYSRH